jgi:CheY-like chemotaxis protein
MKILYVEHDDNNLYMLKTRLERCGDFEVLAAKDSEHGCKLAVTEHPDVIKKARQRLVLCRLIIDIMRTVHGTYAPVSAPFGTRLETLFVSLCVAIGDLEGKPFSVAKIATYMRVPRTTVIRRLDRLQGWGLTPRPSLLHARKDAQCSYRDAKLPTGATLSEQGY